MDLLVIEDENQYKYEDEMVTEFLRAGWLPDVEYVARYEAVAASGSPLDEAIHQAQEGYLNVGSTNGLSVRTGMEYESGVYSIHDRPRYLTAWVKGRVPSPEEARQILDEHGRKGSPTNVTPTDVLVDLNERRVAYSSSLEKNAK